MCRIVKQTNHWRNIYVFTTEHFIWLGLCDIFVALLTYISKKFNFSLKTAGYIMCAICAISEISKIMSDMMESENGGMFLDPKSLPFHLCSLMIFAVLFITFGKDGKAKQTIIDFVAVMGTLGSICALLIPTNGTDFTKILAYQCFVYHAGLLYFSLYLIVGGYARLGKALGKNMLVLLSLVWAMIYINSALSQYDTNFMYLVRPPMENIPFLTLDYGWYVYFLHILSLGAAIITLFHLPFIIRDKKAARANKP